jgi:hypothetical protein
MPIAEEVAMTVCRSLLDLKFPEGAISEVITEMFEKIIRQPKNAVAVPEDVWKLVSRI